MTNVIVSQNVLITIKVVKLLQKNLQINA